MFWRVLKEFLIAIFWVFLILIVGYFILDFMINKRVPILGGIASFVEQHAQGNNY